MADKENRKRLAKKFKLELNHLIIYAKASSINAKVGAIYPESFMVAYLSTGEHEITSSLLNNEADLENLLQIFKNLLDKKKVENQGTPNYHGLTISSSVWDAIKEAEKIASNQKNEEIGIADLFLGFLKTFDPLKQILKDEGISVPKLTEDLLAGKFKKASKSKKTKRETKETGDVLNSLCTNITEKAQNGELDPIIARDEEIEQAITILCRRNKRNPMFVGDPGVGKTAILDGIAQRIVSNTVPEKLKGCSIYSLNISDMVAGTKYRGEFENRIKDLLKEIEQNQSIILFIDEIHTMIGAGSASGGSLDAANIFKPALARGLRCIGATTVKEYKKYISGDGALERRFEKIDVDEPNEDQTIQILNGIKHKLESYHNCEISTEAIETAVRLSARYVNTNFFPDKAIGCVDTACAKYAWGDKDSKSILQPEDIIAVISKKTKIPKEIMSVNERTRIDDMEQRLKNKIFGQDKAIEAIHKVIMKSYSGISNKNRPIGVFVFGGPSGTGKTFTAQETAKILFQKPESFIQIDMSEYSEKHTVSRILGSPPSYVGYDDAETELDKVKRNPYSIVLLDEVDKADPQVMKLFLQVMKEGTMTNASGEKINWKNTILVLTGNFGMNEKKSVSIGFDDKKKVTSFEMEQNRLVAACKAMFGAEFVNRVDEFIPFEHLSKEDMSSIIKYHLEELSTRMPHKNYKVNYSDKVTDKILEIKEKEHGQNAMMIDRIISKYIEPILSEIILDINDIDNYKVSVTIDTKDGELVSRIRKTKIK